MLGVAALVFVLGACGDEPSTASPAGGDSGRAGHTPATVKATFEPLPEGAWTDLARQLANAGDLEAAVATTREALARGGIGTLGDTRPLVAPQGPPSSFTATPMETVRLAMEARHKRTAARMDGAELAQMLQAFGWPLGESGGDDQADDPILGGMAGEDTDAWQQAASDAREAERAARDAGREQARAAYDAAMAGPEAVRTAARAAHRDAAKAHAAAAAADRPRTMARMRAALERARAADLAWREAREQWQAGDGARRAKVEAGEAQREMEERVARQVGPDYAAGEQLMAFMAAWIAEARRHPDDPRSFTPLFLAEMARLQSVPVDLAGQRRVSPLADFEAQPYKRSAPRSTQWHLTLLELELFAAAFHRNEVPAQRSDVATLVALLVPAAHAQPTPCSDIKESMGPDLGELHGLGVAETAGHVLGGVVETAFGEAADALDNAIAATAIVGKIIKVAAFYSEEQVSVTADPSGMHKPLGNYRKATYTATAGVDPRELDAYRRLSGTMSGADQAFRDCMGWAGFPTTTTIAEVARDAENWLIDWTLVEGAPPHAVWSPRDNDLYVKGVRQATKMKRVSPSTASADFVVRVLPESGHEGPRFRAYLVARAEVDAAGMPSLGTLVSAGKGLLGLADSLVEIASGWIMVMFKPKAYAGIDLDYHCPNPTTVHRYVRNAVADGEGDDGDPCTIVFETREEAEAWQAARD